MFRVCAHAMSKCHQFQILIRFEFNIKLMLRWSSSAILSNSVNICKSFISFLKIVMNFWSLQVKPFHVSVPFRLPETTQSCYVFKVKLLEIRIANIWCKKKKKQLVFQTPLVFHTSSNGKKALYRPYRPCLHLHIRAVDVVMWTGTLKSLG